MNLKKKENRNNFKYIKINGKKFINQPNKKIKLRINITTIYKQIILQ